MGQDFARKILFTDEKKFCLFDSRHGKWILTRGDESYNIARYLDMTDEEYREWVQEHRGERLPRTKQRGLYPCFVWGGVGYNKKSKLYFLEAGETLTADRYRCILQENLLPVRKQYPRSWYGTRGTMHITMDNDSKHYNKTLVSSCATTTSNWLDAIVMTWMGTQTWFLDPAGRSKNRFLMTNLLRTGAILLIFMLRSCETTTQMSHMCIRVSNHMD